LPDQQLPSAVVPPSLVIQLPVVPEQKQEHPVALPVVPEQKQEHPAAAAPAPDVAVDAIPVLGSHDVDKNVSELITMIRERTAEMLRTQAMESSIKKVFTWCAAHPGKMDEKKRFIYLDGFFAHRLSLFPTDILGCLQNFF
jgi:hypothetical protein